MTITLDKPLRVLGTRVTLLEDVREQAQRDLGFPIAFDVLDGVAAQQKAVTAPGSFDVYDQWFNSIDLLWTARSVQPIDIARISLWPEVSDLTKVGRFTSNGGIGSGDAPVKKLYVQEDGLLGSVPSDRISMLPTAHNADAFGYNPLITGDLGPGEQDSWAWLLDDRWKGKVALLQDPAIGSIDAALSVQANGLARFDDIGNMSLEEIDTLIDLLLSKKKAGHFRGFWSTHSQSVRLMGRNEVLLESMWSPAIVALRAKRKPITSACPKEGLRGWHSGMCLSAQDEGKVLDAAYAYLNWWLTGWVGAVMARQGYYMSVPGRTREHLSASEWDYWYEGAAATEDLQDPAGMVVVRKGETRDGGSYWQRMNNVAVWNTVMDEHNYLVRRWSEFLRA